MRKLLIFLLLLVPLVVRSQVTLGAKGSGNQYTITNNLADIRADLTVDDTTALKAKAFIEGDFAYLKQLSATNSAGGGWFVVADSTHPEGIGAFDHTSQAYQWIRTELVESPRAWNFRWAGANGTASDDAAALNAMLDQLNTLSYEVDLFIPKGNYYIGSAGTQSLINKINLIGEEGATFYGTSTESMFLLKNTTTIKNLSFINADTCLSLQYLTNSAAVDDTAKVVTIDNCYFKVRRAIIANGADVDSSAWAEEVEIKNSYFFQTAFPIWIEEQWIKRINIHDNKFIEQIWWADSTWISTGSNCHAISVGSPPSDPYYVTFVAERNLFDEVHDYRAGNVYTIVPYTHKNTIRYNTFRELHVYVPADNGYNTCSAMYLRGGDSRDDISYNEFYNASNCYGAISAKQGVYSIAADSAYMRVVGNTFVNTDEYNDEVAALPGTGVEFSIGINDQATTLDGFIHWNENKFYNIVSPIISERHAFQVVGEINNNHFVQGTGGLGRLAIELTSPGFESLVINGNNSYNYYALTRMLATFGQIKSVSITNNTVFSDTSFAVSSIIYTNCIPRIIDVSNNTVALTKEGMALTDYNTYGWDTFLTIGDNSVNYQVHNDTAYYKSRIFVRNNMVSGGQYSLNSQVVNLDATNYVDTVGYCVVSDNIVDIGNRLFRSEYVINDLIIADNKLSNMYIKGNETTNDPIEIQNSVAKLKVIGNIGEYYETEEVGLDSVLSGKDSVNVNTDVLELGDDGGTWDNGALKNVQITWNSQIPDTVAYWVTGIREGFFTLKLSDAVDANKRFLWRITTLNEY